MMTLAPIVMSSPEACFTLVISVREFLSTPSPPSSVLQEMSLFCSLDTHAAISSSRSIKASPLPCTHRASFPNF